MMQRSDGGGVFDIIDRMNGQTLCGCNTVTACQVSPFSLLSTFSWVFINFFTVF